MHQEERSFTGQASSTKGQEFQRRDGSWVWYNASPYFRVYFFPGKEGEKQQVWYRLWDSEVIITGYNLSKIYKQLKDGDVTAIKESSEPWQPGSTEPYIESIEHKDRP